MKYNVLIVDDEEPARDLMASYAAKVDELEIIDVVDNALSAKKIIHEHEVDILLTDIQMDDLTGIDLLRTLKQAPVTIFTTAYSEYALEGYDLDVVDYLVKPISFQRFCKAIDKAKELIQYTQQSHSAPPPNQSKEALLAIPSFFFVKTSRKLVKVNYADILYVQSYGEYVKIFTDHDVHLALQTTRFMEELLPASQFIRIHRSYIINVEKIREIEGNEVLIGQQRLSISKRLKDNFIRFIAEKGII